ncbi:MAG: Mth938-like domain-containing protein [Gammaproteobacteria bacterium]|nr:Mth938-like domain-containing protein [Gammaproteobacteria bacterium]
MQVNLDKDIHSYTIRACEPGLISLTVPYTAENMPQSSSEEPASRPLGIETISGSFIVSPRHLLRDWPPASISDLQAEHFEAIIELQPELVLLGTGTQLTFPPPQLLAALHRQRVGVEVMDTAAACRTYNILMAEGRFVVAGLINPAEN